MLLAAVIISILAVCRQCRPLNAYDDQQQFDYDADVIIIGAGIAGISSARELSRNGFENFLILEGRSAIGGRFQDVKIGNVTVELGPNWVHGTENNPIFALVQKFSIRGQIENPNSIICRDSEGKNVTLEFLQTRSKLKTIVRELGQKYSNMSLREALRLKGWVNRTAIENTVEYALIDFMDAVPPELIAGNYNNKYNARIDSLLGSQFFITDQDGYKKLVLGLAKEILMGDANKIKLNHTVERIYWSKQGVRVQTTDKLSFTAKILISTASAGVYKNFQHLFQPELPKWKQAALQKSKLATYTKLFLKFPYRFWDNVEYIYYAGENRGRYPVWQSLDAENRFGLDTNVLMVTVTSTESFQVENMTRDDLINDVMEILRPVYGANIPPPIDIVVPTWSKKDLFFGSYSYFPQNLTHHDFVALKANAGPIFFAGEATHEVYQGYIHGAYFEGINRAFDVIQALMKYNDVSNTHLNHDYYDNCLRDSCHCCHK